MALINRIALAAALLGAATLQAHFVWVETASIFKLGEPAKVRIGYGHDLAKSGAAPGAEGLKLWAVSPSGARIDLQPVAEGDWLAAEFTPKEKGVYRIVFVQDRGILSQTTNGYRPGGRDVHPDAKRSFKSWRTGSVYASASGASGAKTTGKPSGLPLEILAERAKGKVNLTVLRDGKPAQGVEVTCAVPGKSTVEKVGATGANGRISYDAPAGPALFLATVSTPAPAGSNYDSDNQSAGVLVN